MSISAREWLAAACVVGLYLLAMYPSPEFPAYNSDDGSWFITLALNLLEQGRYSTDTFPGFPYGHHATWPPIFPLMLAGVISVAGLSWAAMKILTVSLGLVGLYFWWRLFAREPHGRVAVLALALSPAYFLFAHHPMAEMPFMVLCAVTLVVLEKAENPGLAFAAGMLAAVTFLTRGYAAAFLPAGLLWFLLLRGQPWPHRVFMAAAFVVPLVIAILGWRAYTAQILATQPLDAITAHFGNGVGLLGGFLQSPAAHIRNLYWFELRYPLHFVIPALPLKAVLSSTPLFFLSALLTGLALVGWLSRLRDRLTPGDLWVPCTALLLYGVAAVNQGHSVRYWIMLVPFGFVYLLAGAEAIGRILRFPGLGRAAGVALIVSMATGMGLHLWDPDRLRFADPFWRDYRDLAVWARKNIPSGTPVVAPSAHKFYAVTGLPVYPPEQVDRLRVSDSSVVVVLCGESDRIPKPHRIWCRTALAGIRPIQRAGGLSLFRLPKERLATEAPSFSG